MSSDQKKISSEEQDQKDTVSVFDFLYRDTGRIASFLSQFDPSGHLTEITQGNTAGRSREDRGTIDGQISIPLSAKVASTVVAATTARHDAQVQRQYDPSWANALSLLDYLTKHGLLNRDVSSASIGSFVLCSGTISLADLQLMDKTWRLPAVKRLMTASIPNSLPDTPKGMRNNPEIIILKKKAEEAAKNGKDALDLFFDMISILPHTLQARLSGNSKVWCSLVPSGLTFDAADISLKYGSSVPGNWYALGILDAVPDEMDAGGQVNDWGNGAEMAVKMMGIIAPITRNLLGRPPEFYGITPLLIFREVEAQLS